MRYDRGVSASESGILLVSEVFPPAIGGSGVLLENIYRRLPDSHVRVLAHQAPTGMAPYPGPLEVSEVSMAAPDWGVLHPASLRRHVRVSRAIGRLLGEESAIVHCARALPEGLSAALPCGGLRRPYTCWVHGEELGFASTSRELTFLARRVYRRAAAVFANSRNSARMVTRDWGVPDSRVHLVYPGVDVDRFRPDVAAAELRHRVAPDGQLILLSVGRLQRRKGHDLVLKALASLQPALPHLRYVVVGDGPHQTQLQADVRALGLSNIVSFVGPASDDDLPRWYAAADIFVLPNRSDGVDFEGFGIVFLEAGAAGLPVIAGRSGGAPESIEEGVTGRLVSGTDPQELATVVSELARSRDLRATYGVAGRARAVSRFSWERAATEVATVHRGLVACPGTESLRLRV